MLRRVAENVVVAVLVSALTLAVKDPGGSAETFEPFFGRVLSDVAQYAGPLDRWLWGTALALGVAGVALQIGSMIPPHPNASWGWTLSMPSAPTNLMGVGLALGLTAGAVTLAESGSYWALPLLAVAVYWSFRWATAIRYRWASATRLL